MSNVKNYGLDGIASSVQLGKGGAKIASESGAITAKDAAGTLVNVQAADPVAAQDLVTKNFVDNLDGMAFTLGTPTDSSLTGAVAITSETTVTNAVDKLNEILGKLVPAAPVGFPGSDTLTVTSVGTSPLLASGAVPDNTGGGTLPVSAGSAVTRVTAATVSTNSIGATIDVGPGDSGTLQALVNGAVVDSQVLSVGSNLKTSGVLRVEKDREFPVGTPGFWESVGGKIEGGAATQGWNRFKMTHTGASSTNDVYFVRDNLTASPVVSALTVSEEALGVPRYSSGIPHYNTGASLLVSFNATNLAGETYRSGNILGVTGSNSIITAKNFAPGTAGLPAVLARQTLSFDASNLSIAIDGSNVHNSGVLSANANNVNGTGTLASTTNVLVMRGTTTRVDEMSVPVTVAVNGGATGNGTRVVMGNTDFPATNVTALTTGDWDSAATPATHEAAVVGGVLKHDVVNYSTGYLPAGPDRSGNDSAQYVTFMFRRTAASKFDIAITGSYDQLYVKLPGLSDTYSSSNGWYSMKTLYGGAGMPGDQGGANGSIGCALGAVANGSGSWTATFGTLSSTNSANNIVLVRVKLLAGQSITAISFVPATR